MHPETHIYLDNNATTPVAPEVVHAMLGYLQRDWGNPSSAHFFGRGPKKGLADARERVAALLGAKPEEIVFTSGGTESDVMAILGVARARRKASGATWLLGSAVEHFGVLAPMRQLESEGFQTELLPVDSAGRPDPSQFAEQLCGETALVSVMAANNESGTVLPVAEIAALCRERGIPIHTDAVNAAGKCAVGVDDLGVDLLSLSAHKFHGPRGVGLLYVRAGTPIEPLMIGGGQEHGLRGGTENVAGIVGLATALELALEDLEAHVEKMTRLTTTLLGGLRELRSDLQLNSPETGRLPNTLNISFPGESAADLARRLDELGVAVSTGAACHDGGTLGSHVLTAMGIDSERASGAMRISLSRYTTEQDVARTLEQFSALLLTV